MWWIDLRQIVHRERLTMHNIVTFVAESRWPPIYIVWLTVNVQTYALGIYNNVCRRWHTYIPATIISIVEQLYANVLSLWWHNLYWLWGSIMHSPTPGRPHRAASLMINTASDGLHTHCWSLLMERAECRPAAPEVMHSSGTDCSSTVHVSIVYCMCIQCHTY